MTESPGGESKVLHRGYSVFPTKGTPLVDGPSTHTNVIIKQPLPARGVVSSNPKRVERLLQNAKENQLLTDIKTHTNVGWGVTIYTAVYKNDVEIFIAGVPMGSAGSGFAFFEMFAAGAQAVSTVATHHQSELSVKETAYTHISFLLDLSIFNISDYKIWLQRSESDFGKLERIGHRGQGGQHSWPLWCWR
jgi:hypothetical protein